MVKRSEGTVRIEFDKAEIETEPRGLDRAKFLCESYSKSSVSLDDRELEKLVLTGRIIETGEEINVSGARILDSEQKVVNTGLWVKIKDGRVQFGTLVKVLMKYSLKKIEDMLGKEFFVLRDERGFWILDGVD